MVIALLIIIIIAMGYVIYRQHEEIVMLHEIHDAVEEQIEEAMKKYEPEAYKQMVAAGFYEERK